MAVLTSQQRAEAQSVFVADLNISREAIGVTRADLRAALNALDDYLDTNAAAINTAIPQPARAALTAKQKARLLAYVALKRYGVI